MLASQEQEESNDQGCNRKSESRYPPALGSALTPNATGWRSPKGHPLPPISPTPSPAPRNPDDDCSFPRLKLRALCIFTPHYPCLLGHKCTLESFLGICQRMGGLNVGIITLNTATAIVSCLTRNSPIKRTNDRCIQRHE